MWGAVAQASLRTVQRQHSIGAGLAKRRFAGREKYVPYQRSAYSTSGKLARPREDPFLGLLQGRTRPLGNPAEYSRIQEASPILARFSSGTPVSAKPRAKIKLPRNLEEQFNSIRQTPASTGPFFAGETPLAAPPASVGHDASVLQSLFLQWRWFASKRKTESAKKSATRQRRMEAAAKHIIHSYRLRSWSGWREATLRTRPVRTAAVFYIRSTKKYKFGVWRQAVAQSVRQRAMDEKGKAFLLRIIHRELAKNWNRWTEYWELARKTKRAVSMWSDGTRAWALAAWKAALAHKQENRAKLEGALARLMLRELASAWNQWAEYVVVSQKVTGALARLASRELAGAWNRWLEVMDLADKTRRAMSM